MDDGREKGKLITSWVWEKPFFSASCLQRTPKDMEKKESPYRSWNRFIWRCNHLRTQSMKNQMLPLPLTFRLPTHRLVTESSDLGFGRVHGNPHTYFHPRFIFPRLSFR